MADDLFTPTIAPAAYRTRRPPWRPQSLLFPAVLGGPTAVTVLALINGARLGVPRRANLAVAAAGLAGLLARIVITYAMTTEGSVDPGRLLAALAGGLVWLAASAAQRGRFRAFELRGGEHASLWWPGAAAVIGLGFVENVLVLLVAGA